MWDMPDLLPIFMAELMQQEPPDLVAGARLFSQHFMDAGVEPPTSQRCQAVCGGGAKVGKETFCSYTSSTFGLKVSGLRAHAE